MAAQDKSGFKNMTPAQKAAAFDASHDDPAGYAAANFVDPDKTTQLRVVKPTTETPTTLPRRGKHKKG